MDNKKIPTWFGTAVIIIFAATAGAFVWKVVEKQDANKQSQSHTAQLNPTKEKQKQNNEQKDEVADTIATSDWKTCKNIEYDYTIKFPSDWNMTQHPIVKPIDSCKNVNRLYIAKDLYNNTAGFVVIDVFTKKQFQSTTAPSSTYFGVKNLDDFIKKNPMVFKKDILLKESYIQGERAIWTRVNTVKKEVITTVYLFHNGTLYTIESNNVDQNTFEAFISTLKFIN